MKLFIYGELLLNQINFMSDYLKTALKLLYAFQEPFIQIDLKSCIMEQLVPVAINYSLQKDTFEITTVTQLEPVAGRMKERMTEKSGTPVKLQQIRYEFPRSR